MMNGRVVGDGTMAAGKGTPLSRLLKTFKSPEERVLAIFVSTLSRRPAEREAARWLAHVRRKSGHEGYEDMMWTLLNTSEFLFNH
jgi:hypothetical protein